MVTNLFKQFNYRTQLKSHSNQHLNKLVNLTRNKLHNNVKHYSGHLTHADITYINALSRQYRILTKEQTKRECVQKKLKRKERWHYIHTSNKKTHIHNYRDTILRTQDFLMRKLLSKERTLIKRATRKLNRPLTCEESKVLLLKHS